MRTGYKFHAPYFPSNARNRLAESIDRGVDLDIYTGKFIRATKNSRKNKRAHSLSMLNGLL